MGEGGSVESFAKDSVSIHTMLVFLNENTLFHVENTPFHIFLKIHLFIFMNIKYVCTYICVYVHTYRYVHTVGGFGVPIRDFLGDFFGTKNFVEKKYFCVNEPLDGKKMFLRSKMFLPSRHVENATCEIHDTFRENPL